MEKNKSDIIIINAFPNSDDKILLLVEQLMYLKKLNKPILLVSGCLVPEFIQKKVDYLLVNTENEVIGKDHSNYLRQNNIHEFVFDVIENTPHEFWFYWANVNSTITKNIKLGFNLAKLLGYTTAFYTEDDNVWKDGSFDYINNTLGKLKTGDYRMGGVIGEQVGIDQPMIFTTFFFANIEYFCAKFTIPHDAKDWYDLDKIKKYKLNKTYETLFYNFFKNDRGIFYNTKIQFDSLLDDNATKVGFSLNDRRHSEKNLINTFFTVLPSENGNEKYLMLFNRSDYLKTGVKVYNVSVYYDDVFQATININPLEYFMYLLSDNIKKIKLMVKDYGTIDIDCSKESIANNGLYLNYNTQKKPKETIDYIVGGRMGDFFQVLYVAHQNYLQTGKKGNVYITNNLDYGGDAFTKPLEVLYPELLPIMNQQDYIEKFEIFNNQTNDFINLNDWRLPENFKPENFPWINLFNKVYLTQYEKLTYQAWIKFSDVDFRFKDKVVIHRAHYRTTEDEINWEQLIRDNDCIFVGFEETQYDAFPYKNMLPFHKIDTLGDFCAILNACKFYIGNQTGPLSIAHAMDIPRLCELWDIDAVHYVGEEKYFKELNWVSNVHPMPILGTINNHIKYEPLYTFKEYELSNR